MKQLLITIAAVVLVGCGPSVEDDKELVELSEKLYELSQTPPAPELKPIERIAGAKAPDISIHEAAGKGNIAAVKQHLAAGTDVNAKDVIRSTALHAAAIVGNNEIAELLIANAADVNAKDVTRMAPLHDAVVNGHKEIAKLLIAEGASVNTRDSIGFTPLDLAFMKFKNLNEEMADLLRKHGGKTAEELKAEGK